MHVTTSKRLAGFRREVKRCPSCQQRFSRDAAFCPFDGVPLELAAFDPFSDPLIGSRIDGRYDVVSVVGEGGMGRIYEVRHASLDRAFAMKVLRPELARDADLAARFTREARTTASVKHPNVVAITDFGRLGDGVPYFVMELLVGYTLGDVIKRGGPIPAERGVRLARQVAAALGAAHAAGVVHRDLKPDNVFLVGADPDSREPSREEALIGSDADVRVVDFGAAKVVGSSRVTRAGVVFGTPHYMSPEQASGLAVDHRTDVYSLGVIMYEMFAGRVPFEADTYMGVLTQHMFVTPVPPSQVPGASRELGALEEIVLKCLAKKPDERFASMAELVGAIDEALRVAGRASPRPGEGALDSRANRSSVRERMADELELPSLAEMRGAAANEPRSRAGRDRGRGWGLAAAAVALAGATLGALVVVHLRGAGPAPATPSTSATAAAQPTPRTPALEPVGLVPAPSATLVAGTDVDAGSPGARAASHPASPRLPRPPTSGGMSGEMDDVGDPFAGRH